MLCRVNFPAALETGDQLIGRVKIQMVLAVGVERDGVG
jgi:hypothetical protein